MLVIDQGWLVTAVAGTQILAEERHHVILEADRHGAGVGAGIDLEAVGDAVVVEDVVQLAGIDAQAVLVADIHRDGVILAQIGDVLIDEGERRVGGPFARTSGCGTPSGRSR